MTPRPAWIAVAAVGAVAIALLLFLGPSLLPKGPEARATTCSGTTEVYASPHDLGSAQVAGDRVVWEARTPASGSPGFDSDVMLYDLATGRATTLAGGPGLQAGPVIDETQAAWRDEDLSTHQVRVMVHDFVRGTTQPLEWPTPATNLVPLLLREGHLVVEATPAQGAEGAFDFDLANGTATRLTEAALQGASMDQGRIVWVAKSSAGGWDLILHDVRTGETRIALHSALGIDKPAIQGDGIYYMRTSDGTPSATWDVYSFNLTTQQASPIATDEGGSRIQQAPAVHGPWLVWLEYPPSAQADLLARNLITGETRHVAQGFLDSRVDAWGNRVVDVRADTGRAGYGVYLACL